MILSAACDNQIKLRFLQNRPFAWCDGEVISTTQLTTDLERLKHQLLLSQGDVLITCKRRYVFSVALLATWLSGRQAILPPNYHTATLDHIRNKHQITIVLGDDCLELLSEHIDVCEQPYLELAFNRQQPALTLYTSGSSGDPKAVKKTIDNLFAEAFALQTILPECDSPLVASVPPNHLYGLTFSIFLPWVMGKPIVDECPLHAVEVLDVMQRVQADILVTVPVHLRAMLEQDMSFAPKMVISSAGSLDASIAKQWYERFGHEVVEVYGSSETGIIAHRQQLRDASWQLFSGVCIDQFDGCLQVSSPFIHASEGKVFQSKDRVSIQSDGFVLHGRADAIVKIAGKRVSLLAIEKAMKTCVGIVDAAVIAVPVNGHIRDVAIWAVLACENTTTMTGRDVRVMLQAKLDGIEIPRRIIVQKVLPREDNGKLRRDKILALFEAEQA